MDSRNSSFGHITPLRTIKKNNAFNTSGSRLVNSNRFSPFGTSSPKLLRTNNSGSSAMNRSPSGPLLTSINFNSNLSTYMDSKSPGLAERVVQYNKNESPKPCITHQPKYGSPGIFPVVHLFKKNIPVRTISPSHKVTVRLPGQDIYQSYNNDNKSHLNQQNASSDVEKSNVLEALKNISRKRMLAEEDYIQPNNSKRHCREIEETDMSMESQPSTPNDGIPFVVNAITASLSSSHPHLIPSLHKKISTTQSQLKAAQCNMETQTETNSTTISTIADIHEIPSVSKKKSLEVVDESPKDNDDNSSEEIISISSSITSPIDEKKLLKEKQLESVKRNKLTKFLCLLSRETPDKAITDVSEIDASSKTKVTSILSPENKPKHNRHVTFDLPEKEKVKDLLENTKTDSEVTPFTVNNNEAKKVEGLSGDNNKENAGFAIGNKETTGFSIDSKKENGGFTLSQVNKNLGFSFGQTTEKEVSKVENTQVVPPTTTASDLNTTKPTPPLHRSVPSPSLHGCLPPPMFTVNKQETPLPMSSSPKLGGFKFDFKSPTSAATTPSQFESGDTTRLFNVSTAPSNTISNQTNANITFGLPSQQSEVNSKSVSSVSTSGIFSPGFGTNSSINTTLGSNTNVTSSSNTLFSTGFGTVSAANPITSPPKSNMMQPNANTIFSTSNSPAKSPESNTNVTSSTASAIFSTGFGTTATSNPAPFTFGTKSNNETKSFGINFGIPSTQNSNENKSIFTAPTLAPTNANQSQGFPTSTSANNMFGSEFGPFGIPFNSATSSLSAPPPFPTLTTTTTAASSSNNTFRSIFSSNEPKPSLATGIPAFGTNNVTITTTSSLTTENVKTNSFGGGGTFTFGTTAPPTSSFGSTFQFGRDKSNVAEPTPQKPSMFDASATSKPKTDFFKFGTSNPTANVASPFNTSTTLASPTFNAPSASNQPSTFNSGVSLPNHTSPFNSNPKPVSTFTSSFGTDQPFDLSSGSKAPAPSFNMASNTANPVPALPTATVPSFNNMFGSVPTTMFNTQPNPNFAVPSFNNGPPPQFNNANNGFPTQFMAPQTKMFNIGSGSATPRNRTTLKARRRT